MESRCQVRNTIIFALTPLGRSVVGNKYIRLFVRFTCMTLRRCAHTMGSLFDAAGNLSVMLPHGVLAGVASRLPVTEDGGRQRKLAQLCFCHHLTSTLTPLSLQPNVLRKQSSSLFGFDSKYSTVKAIVPHHSVLEAATRPSYLTPTTRSCVQPDLRHSLS